MRTSTLLAAFALAFVVIGCQAAPKEMPESRSEGGPSSALFERQPIDIAVLPVYTGRKFEPSLAKALRGTVKDELLDKRYSPVSFDSIDSKLGDFPDSRELDLHTMRGNFDEDALLYVRLDQWDDSMLSKHQFMLVGLTFTLYDSRTGSQLWTHRVTDRSMRMPSPNRPEGDKTTEGYIASQLVSEALATLPTKDQARKGMGG